MEGLDFNFRTEWNQQWFSSQFIGEYDNFKPLSIDFSSHFHWSANSPGSLAELTKVCTNLFR